jgi:hypothetical protein
MPAELMPLALDLPPVARALFLAVFFGAAAFLAAFLAVFFGAAAFLAVFFGAAAFLAAVFFGAAAFLAALFVAMFALLWMERSHAIRQRMNGLTVNTEESARSTLVAREALLEPTARAAHGVADAAHLHPVAGEAARRRPSGRRRR